MQSEHGRDSTPLEPHIIVARRAAHYHWVVKLIDDGKMSDGESYSLRQVNFMLAEVLDGLVRELRGGDGLKKMTETTVPHPSEFIVEELEARGWGRINLAIRMGGDAGRNLLVWDLYREVGPDKPGMLMGKRMARQLSEAFDVSPEFFLNLHSAWRAQHVH